MSKFNKFSKNHVTYNQRFLFSFFGIRIEKKSLKKKIKISDLEFDDWLFSHLK